MKIIFDMKCKQCDNRLVLVKKGNENIAYGISEIDTSAMRRTFIRCKECNNENLRWR